MIREYFEGLASEHRLVQHSEAKPHFASSMDDAASLMARRLSYPAVFLDRGDFEVSGADGNYFTDSDYILSFVEHVKDSGNELEKEEAFRKTGRILLDFLGRMVRDKRKLVRPMVRCSISGARALRVENADAALYGWLLMVKITESLNPLNCNENFAK